MRTFACHGTTGNEFDLFFGLDPVRPIGVVQTNGEFGVVVGLLDNAAIGQRCGKKIAPNAMVWSALDDLMCARRLLGCDSAKSEKEKGAVQGSAQK